MFEKPSVFFSFLTSNSIPSSSRSLCKSFINGVKLILRLRGLEEALYAVLRLVSRVSTEERTVVGIESFIPFALIWCVRSFNKSPFISHNIRRRQPIRLERRFQKLRRSKSRRKVRTTNNFESLMMNTKRRCRAIGLSGESPTGSFVGGGDSLFSVHERISEMHGSYSGLAWSDLERIDHAVHSAQFRTFEGC